MNPPRALLVAHGSRDPRAQREAQRVAAAVRAARPGLEVALCYLELADPLLGAAVRAGDVVVPLLLSRGRHLSRDVRAVAAAAGATCAPPLGPDPRLAALLAERVRASGAPAEATVLLVSAGSADPASIADLRTAAAMLAGRRRAPVLAVEAAGAEELLEHASARGEAVAVAPYLLAPGRFAAALAALPARWVAEPLGAGVAEVVLARYDAVRAAGLTPAA